MNTTQRLLDRLNRIRGLRSNMQIGFQFFGDVAGSGIYSARVYSVCNSRGGVTISDCHAFDARKRCAKIRAAIVQARRAAFFVSYEIVTPESAEHGDAAERGFIDPGLGAAPRPLCGAFQTEARPSPCSLSRAVEIWRQTRTRAVDGVAAIEPDESDHDVARAVRIINGMEYETGATESRTLHFPEFMTAARRRELVVLLCS